MGCKTLKWFIIMIYLLFVSYAMSMRRKMQRCANCSLTKISKIENIEKLQGQTFGSFERDPRRIEISGTSISWQNICQAIRWHRRSRNKDIFIKTIFHYFKPFLERFDFTTRQTAENEASSSFSTLHCKNYGVRKYTNGV
jgi:hypothetical protein